MKKTALFLTPLQLRIMAFLTSAVDQEAVCTNLLNDGDGKTEPDITDAYEELYRDVREAQKNPAPILEQWTTFRAGEDRTIRPEQQIQFWPSREEATENARSAVPRHRLVCARLALLDLTEFEQPTPWEETPEEYQPGSITRLFLRNLIHDVQAKRGEADALCALTVDDVIPLLRPDQGLIEHDLRRIADNGGGNTKIMDLA